MEHHSNIVPWQLLCEERGARLRYLSVSDEGTISLEELDAVLGEGRVKLVGVVHVSNVLGTINPVAEVTARARSAGAVSLVDGSQAVPQLRSTSPTWAPTSTPGPGTRRSDRRGSVSCTVGASSSRRCVPS